MKLFSFFENNVSGAKFFRGLREVARNKGQINGMLDCKRVGYTYIAADEVRSFVKKISLAVEAKSFDDIKNTIDTFMVQE